MKNLYFGAIHYEIRTHQFQELTKMDTVQRQSFDRNLRKLSETAEFLTIYRQDCSGYYKDIGDYKNLNGEKYSHTIFHPTRSLVFTHEHRTLSFPLISLLPHRKTDYTVRNVSFYITFVFPT